MPLRLGAVILKVHQSSGYILTMVLTPFLTLSRNYPGCQVRWQEFLSRFHFQWKFVPGARNVADLLIQEAYSSRNCYRDLYIQHLGLSVLTRGAKALAVVAAPFCGAGGLKMSLTTLILTAPARPLPRGLMPHRLSQAADTAIC